VNGESEAQALSTQDLTNSAAFEKNSSLLDPQPVAQKPESQPETGMSSVAQFLPSDANLEHSTPAPDQPLDDESNNAPVDTTMSDATLNDVNPSSTDVAPTEPVLDAPALDAPAKADHQTEQSNLPLVNGSGAAAQPVADVDGSTDVAVESPVADTNPTVSATTAPVAEALVTTTSLDAPITEPPTSDALLSEDQVMADVPSSSLTRSRDEDEQDEPSAKRPKIEDSASTAEAVFKAPEVPPAMPKSEALLEPPSQPVTSIPADPQIPLPTTEKPVVNGASSHLPSRSSYSTDPLTPNQKRILEEKIKNTKKVKSALAFLRPVDPVALNIPHYPNVIKTPMDLGTMEHKLKRDEYASVEDFVVDFEIMVNNCFTFNGPAHAVSGMAMNLRAYFLKQMDSVPSGNSAALPPKPIKKQSPVAKSLPRRESKAGSAAVSVPPAVSPGAANQTFALLPGGTPQIRRDSTAGRPKRAVVPPAPRDLPYSSFKPKRKENQVGLKFCEHVLDELRRPQHDGETLFFREPVDPVALNIPTYFSVIKKPMDIQTMTNKLKNGQYSTAHEFKADFEQMIQNCRTFNPEGNIVRAKGAELERVFNSLWSGKSKWEKAHQPQSQRASSASDVGSEDEESEPEDDGDDEKEATISQLKEQLAAMQGMLSTLTGAKAPKTAGKKKKSASGSTKTKKASTSVVPARAPVAKSSKPKKQRLVTYEEKQEISNATENMTPEQIERLTQIITENVAKYKVSVQQSGFGWYMLTMLLLGHGWR